MSDGSEWPKISIITPNYNYGHFLEETIRSILLQGYPNLEYIIIDGKSTDSSIDVIKKYEKWISYWISEPDKGQANAINKGLSYCTGEIFNFINSDEILNQGALKAIGETMADAEAISGGALSFKTETREQNNLNYIKPRKPLDFRNIIANSHTIQPSIWLKLSKVKQVGFYTEHLHYCFDWEYFLRYFASETKVKYTTLPLCIIRLHPLRKTNENNAEFCRNDVFNALYGLLNNNILSVEYNKIIKASIEEKQWAILVNKILKKDSGSKLKKIIKILNLSLEKPKVRIQWILKYLYSKKLRELIKVKS
jgi:glycosyltransferase involved in cell wall biosynthesis